MVVIALLVITGYSGMNPWLILPATVILFREVFVGGLREYLGVTEWSEDASVRRAGSKQCSNARAKALGWAPAYPSYREGYAAILKG